MVPCVPIFYNLMTKKYRFVYFCLSDVQIYHNLNRDAKILKIKPIIKPADFGLKFNHKSNNDRKLTFCPNEDL